MTEYFWKEACRLEWWNVLYGKIPEYTCKDMYLSYNITAAKPLEIINNFEFSIGMGVGLLFLLAIGIFGITIVELLDRKLGWFIDPLCKKIENRYWKVKYRESAYIRY